MKRKVYLPAGQIEEDDFPDDMTFQQLAALYEKELDHDILACRKDHQSASLCEAIGQAREVELLDLSDPYANMVYQNSLTLLYIAAIKEVLGSGVVTTIENSLSKGLFTNIHAPLTDQTVTAISQAMRRMVEQALPIETRKLNRDEILSYLSSVKSAKRKRLYNSTSELDFGYLCSLKTKQEIFYLHLVPSAGYLKYFELRRYRNGVLLRYPYPDDPEHLKPYQEQRKMYDAFSEEMLWERLCGIHYAADLNEKIARDEMRDIVLLSEALHETKITEIAKRIKEEGRRIILIAGPSSSGKTTFAKRLCVQLRVLGLKPLYLGTDDYFKERAETPLLPDGKRDYESLRAIDTDLFAAQMNGLLKGEKTDIPTFDFIEGKKIFGKRITVLEEGRPIVIEGIHGLNPLLTRQIDDDEKFRIYISPLTSLNIDEHHRVPTTDARLLRRIVRDARTRGRSGAETIRDWPLVRQGEDINIFPYNDKADVFFNSQCLYELAALKKYADPILSAIPQGDPAYPEAERILLLTKFFRPLPDDGIIPNTSILREFIGGSIIQPE